MIFYFASNLLEFEKRKDSKDEEGATLVEDLAENGHKLLVNIISNIPILMKNSYLAKLTAPWFTFPEPDYTEEELAAAGMASNGQSYSQQQQQQQQKQSNPNDRPSAQGNKKENVAKAPINKIAAKLDELRRR